MLKTIIVDDDFKNIKLLSSMLGDYCPRVKIVGVADNIKDAHELIIKSKPDLVFIDIAIPNGKAFELLNKLMPLSFHVVIVTANDKFAIKAIKYDALDYLLKPVDIKELQSVVQKALQIVSKKIANEQLEVLFTQYKINVISTPNLAIPTIEGLLFLNFNEIIRIEASAAYSIIHAVGREKIISSKNIREYEVQLPADFFYRVHNSHIVNIRRLTKYVKGRGGFLTMDDGSIVEIASRRKSDFLNLFR